MDDLHRVGNQVGFAIPPRPGRGDGQSRWDFSLIKSFVIHEQIQIQYRAECINAFNHPNLFTPNTTPPERARKPEPEGALPKRKPPVRQPLEAPPLRTPGRP